MRVLAVDPGREKCGVAVCAAEGIIAQRVVPTAEVAGLVGRWAAEHGVDLVLVGDRTGGKRVLETIRGLPVAACLAEEAETTLAARRRYFRDHPPRGWRRLLPLTLQVPPEPYDDYAAALIGERYLHARGLR
jgi:RNase H-fold protein (predicted Holliday junction resolvase)